MNISKMGRALSLGIITFFLSIGARAADEVDLLVSHDEVLKQVLDQQKTGAISRDEAEELILSRLAEIEGSGQLDVAPGDRKEFLNQIAVKMISEITLK